jgi:hypothetical protein
MADISSDDTSALWIFFAIFIAVFFLAALLRHLCPARSTELDEHEHALISSGCSPGMRNYRCRTRQPAATMELRWFGRSEEPKLGAGILSRCAGLIMMWRTGSCIITLLFSLRCHFSFASKNVVHAPLPERRARQVRAEPISEISVRQITEISLNFVHV